MTTDREALAKAMLAGLVAHRLMDDAEDAIRGGIALDLADIALSHAHAAGEAEPVAWQYRIRVVNSPGGEWGDWRDGRAPTFRGSSYEAEERPLYDHPAPAQEPVAVPARDKMVADLISIADAGRRADGSDIPLGETLRKAAAMLAAAPVSPPADSGEVAKHAKRLSVYTAALLRHINPTQVSEDFSLQWHAVHDQIDRLQAALASTPAPQPGALKRDWVPCPICGEPDMERETDAEGRSLIRCVNLGCPSNGPAITDCPHCNGTGQRQDKRTGKSYPCPRCETPAPQPGGAVKVKALKWRDGPSYSGMQIAECVFGEYWAWDAGSGCWSRGSLPGTLVSGGMKGAQAAAQADYERRILSALSPSPSGWDAGAEAMKRDCAATVESFAPGGENYEPGHDDASMRVAIRGAILALPLPSQPAGEG